jgi:hypothetical protein
MAMGIQGIQASVGSRTIAEALQLATLCHEVSGKLADLKHERDMAAIELEIYVGRCILNVAVPNP